MWGLLGLYKAADEIDEVVHALKGRRPFALKLAFTVFEMVLAVLLIISRSRTSSTTCCCWAWN